MIAPVDVFRGETFDLEAQYLDAAGQPRSLAGVTVTAWLAGPSGAIPVAIAIGNLVQGLYRFRQERALTALWPAGFWTLYVSYADAAETETEAVVTVTVRDPA